VRLSPLTSETRAFICNLFREEWGTIKGPLAMSQRKARSTIGLYAPNLLGYTWTTMARTIGCNAERRSQSPKPCLSSDRGLKLTLVKMKSLVIAGDYPAVNMSLLLAHTARQTNRVDLGRGPLIWEGQVQGSQGGLSRNKVAVGESAAGSPPRNLLKQFGISRSH
jgi:hypothetical protein